VNREARTDRNGRFTVTFPGGDGDYFVMYAALGFAPRRFEVKRVADEDFLVADATLQRAATQLDSVKVTAERRKVGRNEADAPDVSGTERRIDPAQVAPDQLGDLNAMAASLPGVTPVPGADGDPAGFSVLGLSPDQNQTTLNGMSMGGSSLPRDAAVMASLVTSPYDVSTGGFSGGRFNVRSRPGTNFVTRSGSFFGTAPSLQWMDRTGRALGQQTTNGSLGGTMSGPLVYDQAFYNLSMQLGRTSNALRTLLNTSPAGLQASGIAADSVTRLATVLGQQRVPLTVGGLSSDRLSDQGSLFGAFDVTPRSSSSGQSFNLTVNGGWNRQTPASALTGEFPAHSGDRTSWNAGLQGRHSGYLRNILLSETTAGLNATRSWGTPYAELPSGSVLVNSTFDDGTSGVRAIAFGGNPWLRTGQRATTVGAMNQLSWFSLNNRHRLKLTTELRRDGTRQDLGTNLLGSFAYNSLADLAAGQPATFTRQLAPRALDGANYVAALSLGDSYKRTPNLQLQYGVRLDANRFAAGPAANPEVARLFGVSNDARPSRVYVSPRVGFSWAHGKAPQVAGFDGAVRGPRAVVRGGVGCVPERARRHAARRRHREHRTGHRLPAAHLRRRGHPHPRLGRLRRQPRRRARSLRGRLWRRNPGGVGVRERGARRDALRARLPRAALAALQPELVGPGARQPLHRQRRGHLLAQPRPAGLRRPQLPRRAALRPPGRGRPAGVRAAHEHRPGDRRGRVARHPCGAAVRARRRAAERPALRQPAAAGGDRPGELQHGRELVAELRVRHGARAVPRLPERRRRPAGARLGARELRRAPPGRLQRRLQRLRRGAHQLVRQRALGDAVHAAGRGRRQRRRLRQRPRLPVRPGRRRHRPGARRVDARAARRQLGVGAPLPRAPARHHRRAQQLRRAVDARGQPAAGVQPGEAAHAAAHHLLARRLQPIGAVDRLLHGESGLRGWGQASIPDPQLLYVRGFDAQAQRFRYEVNQRFGNVRPQASAFRSPVTLTAMLRVDLGPTRERQLLTQQLDRGRRHAGDKLPEPMLRAMYNNGGLQNPLAQILRQADTLHLTGPQADSIATLNRRYTVRLDSIWSPVARYLAALPADYRHDEAYDRYRAARRATVDLLTHLAPDVRGLLTPDQRRQLPPIVASHLDTRYLASIRNGTAGAGSMPMFGGMMGGMGGSGMMGGGERTVIIR
jgi:hypothetical protein